VQHVRATNWSEVFFENVLDKKMWIDIKYSKIPEKIPEIENR